MSVGIIVIATRKYKVFLNKLIGSLDRYFHPGLNVEYIVLLDEPSFAINQRSSRKLIIKTIEPYIYPYATLYRYKLMVQMEDILKTYDYLLYIDVSMEIVNTLGPEVIHENGLVAVQHPAFYKGKRGGGTYETNQKSNAYVENIRRPYAQGSVQGGCAARYLEAVRTMNDWIIADEENNIMALWHDESHWNKYLNVTDVPVVFLEPAYSHSASFLPRSMKPVILKLDKNHREIRN